MGKATFYYLYLSRTGSNESCFVGILSRLAKKLLGLALAMLSYTFRISQEMTSVTVPLRN